MCFISALCITPSRLKLSHTTGTWAYKVPQARWGQRGWKPAGVEGGTYEIPWAELRLSLLVGGGSQTVNAQGLGLQA